MAITATDYQLSGLKLLPVGKAWPTDLDSNTAGLVLALAHELARAHGMAEDIAAQVIPTKATHLLSDWEEFAGLPDCTVDDELATMEQRQNATGSKLTMASSLSYLFLEKMATDRGYTIKIIDKYPHHCQRGCDYPLYPWHNWYLAFVYVYERPVTGDYGDLECLLERYKPAHINLVYLEV